MTDVLSHLPPTEPITLPEILAANAADPRAAWEAYIANRAADPHLRYGFSPRNVFAAGYAAGQAALLDEVRSSGWAGCDQ